VEHGECGDAVCGAIASQSMQPAAISYDTAGGRLRGTRGCCCVPEMRCAILGKAALRLCMQWCQKYLALSAASNHCISPQTVGRPIVCAKAHGVYIVLPGTDVACVYHFWLT
jgi:hypothetical protein